MQYCRDHPEEVSRLSRVKAQVDQVKGIMMENIDKVIDRGEQIDGLVTRTEQLHNQVCVCYLVFCSVLLIVFRSQDARSIVRSVTSSMHAWCLLICCRLLISGSKACGCVARCGTRT